MLQQFVLQKLLGHLSLLADASRGEHIDGAKLVFALAKVLHLDQTFVDKLPEAIVEPTGVMASCCAISLEVRSGVLFAQATAVRC